MGISNSILNLLLLIIISATATSGAVCSPYQSCGEGTTCCCATRADKHCNLFVCCGMPNAVCCGDGHHCCPGDHPRCNAEYGTCYASLRNIFGIPANKLQPAKRIMSREKIEETLVEFADAV